MDLFFDKDRIDIKRIKELVLSFLVAGLLLASYPCASWINNTFFQEDNQSDFNLQGLWVNDIYHTCTYFDSKENITFEGYCYWQKEMPDFNSEICITGCKLQADYGEDTSDCERFCKTCLIGDC